MFLAFGVTFEVPIAVFVLVYLGAVTVEQLRQARPYFIVGAFVVAAIVTPPDVISQLLLATPLCLLYEVGIFAARFVAGRKREDDEYQPLDGAEAGRELDSIESQEKKNAAER
jgi:sec-independent protein translocase protein TatC